MSNIPVSYSEKAKNDGYDFSSLTDKEQRQSKKLYVSMDVLIDYYFASVTLDKLCEEQDYYPQLNYNWGFPESGIYYGQIIECSKSKKQCSNEYIISFLIDEVDVRYMKFRRSFDDPIYIEIKKAFNIRNTIFNQFDFTELECRPASVEVKNITYNNGKTFSIIKKFHLFRDSQINTLNKMIHLMLEQSN